jgi:uncharacterized protein YndB with AHSA1/START domain
MDDHRDAVKDRGGTRAMAMASRKREAAEEAFVISREFTAPRERVWKAWTEPEQLMQWWGPKGFKMLACKVDLRPGGIFHYGMQAPNGDPMWGKFIYREIVRPERLVVVVSFSDEHGGVTRHPMAPNWPLETLSIVTFAEQQGKTIVNVRWIPINATDEERKLFDSSHESMRMGWTGTMDQLAAHLAKA